MLPCCEATIPGAGLSLASAPSRLAKDLTLGFDCGAWQVPPRGWPGPLHEMSQLVPAQSTPLLGEILGVVYGLVPLAAMGPL